MKHNFLEKLLFAILLAEKKSQFSRTTALPSLAFWTWATRTNSRTLMALDPKPQLWPAWPLATRLSGPRQLAAHADMAAVAVVGVSDPRRGANDFHF